MTLKYEVELSLLQRNYRFVRNTESLNALFISLWTDEQSIDTSSVYGHVIYNMNKKETQTSPKYFSGNFKNM